MKKITNRSLIPFICLLSLCFACNEAAEQSDSVNSVSTEATAEAETSIPAIQHTLTKDQTHSKFSSLIAPVLTVPSGAVIEAFTEDASDEQFEMDSDVSALDSLSFDPIHPLTGPVYVEGAQPGCVEGENSQD